MTMEPKLAIPNATVRLWDSNWQPRRQFETQVSCENGEPRTFALPIDHPAAEWLMSDDSAVLVYATVEDQGTRWCGVLTRIVNRPAGPCPRCEHCQARELLAVFRPM
ncbi:hypothetical protein [Nocardia sp. NPDC003963]